MAFNQGEECSGGFGFCARGLAGRRLNVTVDEFDFACFNCEKQELDDHHKGGKSNMEIADLLPPDPFNMEGSNEGTGWLEDFEKGLGFKANENEVAELGSVLTDKMRIHQDARLQSIDGNRRMNFREGLDGGHGLMDVKKEIIDFSYDKYWNLGDTTDNDHCDVDGGNPSDALLLVLGYLGLRDLLAVEGVCKPLRDAVIGDPLLWRSIHIDFPFCTKITDDILIKLTNRAQGHLHSLSLIHCSKINDAALKHVLVRNPSLSKLNVPGCASLTADGMLSNLKVLKSAGKTRLKYLGIYGLFGMTKQHIEKFKLLIGEDNSKLSTTRKPQFFGGEHLCVTSDDDRAMDVEVCPRCQRLERVYDCPSESCQKKQSASQLCRACTKCIPRCIDCGCCLNNWDFVLEVFLLELLCLDCRRKPSGWQMGEQKIPLREATVVHKGEGYPFYLYG